METDDALQCLSALSHPARLRIFRILMAEVPAGITTGALVDRVRLPQSTCSSQLAHLARAGLVTGEKRGRNQVQRADPARLAALVGFLGETCCGDRPELCGLPKIPEATD